MKGTTFRFEDGTLMIEGPGEIIRLRWAPVPLAETSDSSGKWRECWPEFRLLTPAGDAEAGAEGQATHAPADGGRPAKDPLLSFRALIPSELAQLAEPFRSHQWLLLSLLARAPRAIELVRSSPALGFCVANSHEFREWPASVAAKLAFHHYWHRRRTVAGWLGFPATESAVRVLGKVRPEAVTPTSMRVLRTALVDMPDLAETLQHQPSINAGILFIVSRWRLVQVTTPKLLLEVGQDPNELTEPRAGDTLLDAMKLLHELSPERRVGPFESIDQVRRFHTKVVRAHEDAQRRREEQERLERERLRALAIAARRRHEQHVARANRKTYPPPPLPGTPSIIPITSLEQLAEEGHLQSHCVASHASIVMAGRQYIYRVLAPSRATLALGKGRDGHWRISQLAAAGNRPVPRATWIAVELWLSRCSG